MTDRPTPPPEKASSGADPSEAAMEQVRRQILLHERHDKKQTVLARTATFVMRTGSDGSLDELKTLYKQAEEAQKSNDKERLNALTKQLQEKVRADREALQWQDETSHYATGFAKTMGLFLKGRGGATLTALSFGLDQINPNETPSLQAADFTLGMGKGLLTRRVMGAASNLKLGIAGEASVLGLSSRIIDQALTRGNYYDNNSGRFSFLTAFNKIDSVALDRAALVSDVTTFAGAKLMFGLAGRAGHGSLLSNPFWATTLTGGTFGISSGAASEIIRQRQTGESFDFNKIVRHGLMQGLVDSVAAAPGGLQANSYFRSSLSSRLSHSFNWLRGEANSTKATAPSSAEIVARETLKTTPTQKLGGSHPQEVKKQEPAAPEQIANEDVSTAAPPEKTGKSRKNRRKSNQQASEPADLDKPVTEPKETKVNRPKAEDFTAGGTKDKNAAVKETDKPVQPVKVEVAPEAPVDRTILKKGGADSGVVSRLSEQQARQILKLQDPVRQYFFEAVLKDPAAPAEALEQAIFRSESFLQKSLPEQVQFAEKAVRQLHKRLGMDSEKPLSSTEFLQLDRAQDLLRSRLGIALDEIAKPGQPPEATRELKELVRKKLSDMAEVLDIGNVGTLMGGNHQELVVLKEMRDAIRRTGQTDSVKVVRLLGDLAADHCGFDFALLNVDTGKLLPIDASQRNKFDHGLPLIRSRTVITVPDPTSADIAELWTHVKRQQGIPDSTPQPSAAEMLRLRCDYVLKQLQDSPLRVTDVRLLYDQFVDRQLFSRKVTPADRAEAARDGGGKRKLFQLADGELIHLNAATDRTMPAGLSFAQGLALRELREQRAANGLDVSRMEASTVTRLENYRRMIELQTESIARFVHDLRLLGEKTKSTGNQSARTLLEEYANHTERGALRYFTNKNVADSPIAIADRITNALNR
jgi:hypothetical protein